MAALTFTNIGAGTDAFFEGRNLARTDEQNRYKLEELRRQEAERQAIENDPIFRQQQDVQAPSFAGSGMLEPIKVAPAAAAPQVRMPTTQALPEGERPVQRPVQVQPAVPVQQSTVNGKPAPPSLENVTAAQYQAFTPQQKLDYLKAANARRQLAMAPSLPAYAASGVYDVFAAPINLAARGIEGVANVFDPNKSVVIPKVGDGSLTPMANAQLRNVAANQQMTEAQYLEMLKQRDTTRTATQTKKQQELTAAEEKAVAERATTTEAPDWVYGANKKPIRGLLNNNPGNIDRTKSMWTGEIEGGDKRFKTFATPELGIRAIVENLRSYETKYGINTVEGIIKRWAPPNENDTKSYISFVSQQLGVDPTAQLNLSDPATLQALSTAIILKENGKNPYGQEVISNGVNLALSKQKVDIAGVTAPIYYAGAPSAAPAAGAPAAAPVTASRVPAPAAPVGNPTPQQVQTVAQQVSSAVPAQVVAPNEIFNAASYARPLQAALLRRQQVARLAEIQMQTGNVMKSLQTRATLDTMDNQLYKMQGDQGVAEFLQSGGQDANRMMGVYSYYTGNQMQLQPRSDGLYNMVVNGKVAAQGLPREKVVERVRLTLDEGFRQQQAAIAGKIFDSQLKRDEKSAEQLGKYIADIGIENIKGVNQLNVEKLKAMKYDVKPTGAGDGTVIITPPFGGTPFVFNPAGKSVKIDGIEVQSMSAQPITGMPSLSWANQG
jgi:hypothetical protein